MNKKFPPIKLADDGRNLYDQQPEETARVYSYFLAYATLGRTRTLEKTSKILEMNATHLGMYSKRNHWVERAAAWDQAKDKEHANRMADALRDVAETHVRVGKAFYAIVVQALKRMQTAAMKDDTLILDGKKVAEWAKVAETAAKIQRAAMGQAEAIALSGPDGGPIQVLATTQEDLAFQELMREAEAQIALEAQQAQEPAEH